MIRVLLYMTLLNITAFAVLLFETQAYAQNQPNIVLILSDDQNWRDYSYTGTSSVIDSSANPVRPLTPNIDALAANGLLFNSGYSPVAQCRPSLASMFTGLNPVQTGIYGNDSYTVSGNSKSRESAASEENNILRRNIEYNATLPRMLSDQGYAALQTGKWWEGDYSRAGFTDGYVSDASRELGLATNNTIGRATGSIESRIGGFVDQAIADDKPFFVSYAPFLPHGPHNADDQYTARYDALVSSGEITSSEREYLAMVDWFDDTVGELRDVMQDRGVDNDTIYIYVTDNGYLAGGTSASRGDPSAKRSPSNNGVRTPIMIYQPGQIEDSRTIAEKIEAGDMASSTDILITVMSLLGHEKQDHQQGVNLLTEKRTRMFGETYSAEHVVQIDGKYQVGDAEATRNGLFMVEGNWKLTLIEQENVDGNDPNLFGPAVQLYNLADDPGETSNLASFETERVASMAAEIENWWNNTRPVYHYAHEFNGPAVGLENIAPDVADTSLSTKIWDVAGGLLQDGVIRETSKAQLDFSPEANKRYELRAGISPIGDVGIVLGFLDAGFADNGQSTDDDILDDLLGGVVYRDDTAGNDLQFFADSDGSITSTTVFESDETDILAVTLVLNTYDNDDTLEGDQWSIAMLVNGLQRYEHIYTDGNPLIEHIGIGALGTTENTAALIDYLHLVETPINEFAAVPEPASLSLLAMSGLLMMRRVARGEQCNTR